jgi:hypothetical protein
MTSVNIHYRSFMAIFVMSPSLLHNAIHEQANSNTLKAKPGDTAKSLGGLKCEDQDPLVGLEVQITK